jgi:hypothetical protein
MVFLLGDSTWLTAMTTETGQVIDGRFIPRSLFYRCRWWAMKATLSILCAVGCLSLLAACGSDSSSATGEQENVDECALLTEAEISKTIGAHGPAEQDLYFGGCAWYASVPPTDTGFRPGVIVAVVPNIVFRQVAHVGEPLEGFGQDATYDATHGELWFSCRGDMHCGLKLRIADSEQRAEAARRLGQLVKQRV